MNHHTYCLSETKVSKSSVCRYIPSIRSQKKLAKILNWKNATAALQATWKCRGIKKKQKNLLGLFSIGFGFSTSIRKKSNLPDKNEEINTRFQQIWDSIISVNFLCFEKKTLGLFYRICDRNWYSSIRVNKAVPYTPILDVM